MTMIKTNKRCKVCKDITVSHIKCGLQFICVDCWRELVFDKISNQNIHFCGNDHYINEVSPGFENIVRTLEEAHMTRF